MKTNFSPKVKAAYSKLIKNGEFVAARWLLYQLNTPKHIESIRMSLYNDSAWLCASLIDPIIMAILSE